jgi:hypothetical protein
MDPAQTISLADLKRRSMRAALLSLTGFIIVAFSLAWSAYHLRTLDAAVAEKTMQITEKTTQIAEKTTHIQDLDDRRLKLEKDQVSLRENYNELIYQAQQTQQEVATLAAAQTSARKALAEAEAKTAQKLKELAETEENLRKARGELGAYQKQYSVADNQVRVAQHALRGSPSEPPVSVLVIPRATAKKLEGSTESARAVFQCTIWLDMPDGIRDRIEKATYTFNHPSFPQKPLVSSEAINNFAVAYVGWGALRLVLIDLLDKNGTTYRIQFNMAQALGLESPAGTEKIPLENGKTPFPPGKIEIKDLTRLGPPPQ